MSSGMLRISLSTVAQARSRSSSFPCAASVVDSARNAISTLFMKSSVTRRRPRLRRGRLAPGGVELENGVERRHDRHGDGEPGGAADDGPLQRLDFDPFLRLQID